MKVSPEDMVRQMGELVSLPDIYLRVRAIIEDPESSMTELTAVVSHDPAIAARLLKLANSAFFGFASRVDTVSRAVNLLGGRQVHDLVLATAVADAMSELTLHTMTLQQYWTNSVHCGLLARQCGTECGMVDAERFFVAGLLCDIGHLVMDQFEPDLSKTARDLASTDARPLHELERELFGCDHAEVGATLLQRWNFPPQLAEAVRWQHEPGQAPILPLDAGVAHVASVLLTIGGEDFDPEAALAALDPAAVEVTGIAADVLERVHTSAAEALGEVFELLFPQLRQCA